MNTTSDLERLRATWDVLSRQIEHEGRWLSERVRMDGSRSLRRKLRPLWWGQLVQVLVGATLILIAMPVWTTHRELTPVFVSGLILHVYGACGVLLGGLTLGALSRVDYAQPLVMLQQRLLRLEVLYMRGGIVLGLAWWLLWIPFAAVVFAWFGVDFLSRMGAALPWMVGSGVAGLVGTWLFYRWARQRPELYARMRRDMAGASITAANAEIKALKALEED